MAAAPNSCSPLLSSRTTSWSLWFLSNGFTQLLDKRCYYISVLHIAPGNTFTHLQKEGSFTNPSDEIPEDRDVNIFCFLHTQMWERRVCSLNTSGSFHTKLESRCPPQDISISMTFARLLCCHMLSVSFFFLFPAFMWNFPSLFWPLQLCLWQWPAGSFWTAWSCFIFFCCHYYLPL